MSRYPSGEVDVVFCRDMLNHVEDLDVAFDECRRVLKTDGAMVVYQTFATPLLEPEEALRIYADLVVVPERMSIDDFESRADSAGFSISVLDIVGSQWREAWEEDGRGVTSRQLLRAARLIRCADETLGELGELPYRAELSDALWGVYQMIGKLEPRIYILRL